MASQAKPKMNFMLDLETLSTKKNAAILTVGIVPFTSRGIDPIYPTFYDKVYHLDYNRAHFHVDANTVKWWSNQDAATRAEAMSGTESLTTVLVRIREYFLQFDAFSKVVWGKGSDFDNVILENAFNVCEIPIPWSYLNNRCYRTLEALMPRLLAPRPIANVRHNALDDAMHQAENASRMLSFIEDVGGTNG